MTNDLLCIVEYMSAVALTQPAQPFQSYISIDSKARKALEYFLLMAFPRNYS